MKHPSPFFLHLLSDKNGLLFPWKEESIPEILNGCKVFIYICNCFKLHVCPSLHLVSLFYYLPHFRISLPAVVSQNITNRSCLVSVKSEKYASWVTFRPHWDRCRQGEAEVRVLDFKTTWSEFQKANQTATEQGNAERISNQNVCSPPQSRSQAVVCVSTPWKYPRSGYFLVE